VVAVGIVGYLSWRMEYAWYDYQIAYPGIPHWEILLGNEAIVIAAADLDRSEPFRAGVSIGPTGLARFFTEPFVGGARTYYGTGYQAAGPIPDGAAITVETEAYGDTWTYVQDPQPDWWDEGTFGPWADVGPYNWVQHSAFPAGGSLDNLTIDYVSTAVALAVEAVTHWGAGSWGWGGVGHGGWERGDGWGWGGYVWNHPLRGYIIDTYGDRVVGDYHSQVSVYSYSWVLQGTTTVTASGGAWTFPDLAINGPPGDYVLIITSGTLPPLTVTVTVADRGWNASAGADAQGGGRAVFHYREQESPLPGAWHATGEHDELAARFVGQGLVLSPGGSESYVYDGGTWALTVQTETDETTWTATGEHDELAARFVGQGLVLSPGGSESYVYDSGTGELTVQTETDETTWTAPTARVPTWD
jgi:hypothetical protein